MWFSVFWKLIQSFEHNNRNLFLSIKNRHQWRTYREAYKIKVSDSGFTQQNKSFQMFCVYCLSGQENLVESIELLHTLLLLITNHLRQFPVSSACLPVSKGVQRGLSFYSNFVTYFNENLHLTLWCFKSASILHMNFNTIFWVTWIYQTLVIAMNESVNQQI